MCPAVVAGNLADFGLVGDPQQIWQFQTIFEIAPPVNC
jgi:hypothetical protein